MPPCSLIFSRNGWRALGENGLLPLPLRNERSFSRTTIFEKGTCWALLRVFQHVHLSGWLCLLPCRLCLLCRGLGRNRCPSRYLGGCHVANLLSKKKQKQKYMANSMRVGVLIHRCNRWVTIGRIATSIFNEQGRSFSAVSLVGLTMWVPVALDKATGLERSREARLAVSAAQAGRFQSGHFLGGRVGVCRGVLQLTVPFPWAVNRVENLTGVDRIAFGASTPETTLSPRISTTTMVISSVITISRFLAA